MAENLNADHYRNGDPIPHVKDGEAWGGLTTGAWCYPRNDMKYGASYGRLYNWHAVNDPRGLAPEGWHVPGDNEWQELEMYLGMHRALLDNTGWRGNDTGGKLKKKGTAHWKTPNAGATNESGFSAVPGGTAMWTGHFMCSAHRATGGPPPSTMPILPGTGHSIFPARRFTAPTATREMAFRSVVSGICPPN